MTTPAHPQRCVHFDLCNELELKRCHSGTKCPVDNRDLCDFYHYCASHSSVQSRDIERLKKAIIEVLDTGFESSERDMALVLDRIDAWEKGELRTQGSRDP